VDDQHIIRDGLTSLIQTDPDLQVVGQASNGEEAVAFVDAHEVDVILMDIRMPKMNGVEATKHIRKSHPKIKIVILTTFDDDDYILEAMSNGASGYLLKDTSSDKLFTAIKDSVKGNVILPGEIALKIISHISTNEKKNVKLDDFSSREMDVIHLLVEGKTNTQIADTLFLTVGTVKNYLSQIYSKIDCVDRANAILVFKKMGL
jgi:DNA-binding NarL/FixJ family response regulator